MSGQPRTPNSPLFRGSRVTGQQAELLVILKVSRGAGSDLEATLWSPSEDSPTPATSAL